MTREEAKKELSRYVYNVLENILQFGLPIGTSYEGASNKIVEECMKIAEETDDYQTIDDCVKRARQIAHNNFDCNIDITVTYKDKK